MRFLFLFLFCAALGAASVDESKLAYDAGIMQELGGDASVARANFEKAAAAKGDYSDVARSALVRIYSRDGKTPLANIRSMLQQIKDQSVQENSFVLGIGSLEESRRHQDAIDLGLFFSASFPESSLADDALYMIAKIYYAQGQIDAARVILVQTLGSYPKSNVLNDVRNLLSATYSATGESQDPHLACSFSNDAQEKLTCP